MGNTKHRKDHKKKLALRNAKIQEDKKKYQKFQTEMLMKLIEDEKKKGMFDNIPKMPSIQEGPSIGFEGPSI